MYIYIYICICIYIYIYIYVIIYLILASARVFFWAFPRWVKKFGRGAPLRCLSDIFAPGCPKLSAVVDGQRHCAGRIRPKLSGWVQTCAPEGQRVWSPGGSRASGARLVCMARQRLVGIFGVEAVGR